METTALAHGAYSIGKCMMHIMEKHLIPAMFASQEQCHDGVQKLEVAVVVVVGKEVTPFVRVRKVCYEKPSRAIAQTPTHRHSKHECQAISSRKHANEPNNGPHNCHKQVVRKT